MQLPLCRRPTSAMTELVAVDEQKALVVSVEPDPEPELVARPGVIPGIDLPGGAVAAAALVLYLGLNWVGSVVLGVCDARWVVLLHSRTWESHAGNATVVWTPNATAPYNGTVTAKDLPGPFSLSLLGQAAIFLLLFSAHAVYLLVRKFHPQRLPFDRDDLLFFCTSGFSVPWMFALIGLGSYDSLTAEDRAWWLQGAPELATWHLCTQVYVGFTCLSALGPVLFLWGQLCVKCRDRCRSRDAL